MNKFFFLLLGLFCLMGTGYSQEEEGLLQTVKGKIADKETKESLPGAAIQLIESDTTIAAVTDTSGYFTIQVPVGRQSFRVTFTGYEDLIVPNVLVTSGKEVVLNVELREQVTKIKEVVISAQHNNMQPINSMAAVSVHELSSQDASRFAGGLFDPSRMVSAFAGVGVTDVDINEIVIRGNSPRGILWRLEDIEIPNPNHFPDGQGGSGGSLSMISSDMLSDFDFLTGAFPAEYGNATSGVMDLNLRKGNADKGEYSLLIGDIGTQATLEGPFAKGYQGSYLVNYRYASLALLNNIHLVNLGSYNVAPKFQDLTFAINLPTKKWGSLELFGVGGNNSTGTNAVKDSVLWTDWDKRRDEFERHNLGILGMKYQYNFPNHRTYIKAVAASSTQYDLWDKGYIMQNYQRQTEEREDYTNRTIRANLTINHSFGARSSIRGGILYNHLWANMFEELYLWHQGEFNIGVNGIGSTDFWQAYIQNKYRFSDHLELFAGVHAMMLMLNNKYSIEPRFSLKYKLNQRNVFTFGTGLHSRVEALPVYYSLVPMPDGSIGEGNKNLGLTKAFHNVVGYDYMPNEKIRLKVEAYYQYLFNVPMVDDTSSSESAINLPYGIPDALFKNKGIGRNYGIELTLDKSYENNYYFLYTLSLFDSKFRAGNGNWYNTMFNSHYISNFLIGKDFQLERKHLYTIGLNLKVVYRGGFWTTPIDLAKSQAADRAVYITSETNSNQLPGVLELDFGLNYRENGKGFAWIISADIQNLLNNQNIVSYEYRGSKGDIAMVKGMGIVPVVNFKIEF